MHQFVGSLSTSSISIGFAEPVPHATHHTKYSNENNQLCVELQTDHSLPLWSTEDTSQGFCLCFGYQFHSKTLATKTLNLYLNQGITAVSSFREYCSILIWDKISQTLYIMTDQSGLWPIYYAKDGKGWIFSNSMKHILYNASFHPTLHTDALFELFFMGLILSPDTLIQEIQTLPLYSIITMRPTQQEAQSVAIPFINPEKTTFSETTFLDLMHEAFAPLSSDPQLGILSSGGLDSAFLIGYSAKMLGKSIQTFTTADSANSYEYTSSQLLQREHNTQPHYFFYNSPEEKISKPTTFWRLAEDSVCYLESEGVGMLSLNAALELEFARFIAPLATHSLLTGDQAVSCSSRHPVFYVLNDGLVRSQAAQTALKKAMPGAQNRFIKKHLRSYLTPQYHQEIRAVIVERITSKVRMQTTTAPYLLPFKKLTCYFQKLLHTDPFFSYRNPLRNLCLSHQLVPQEILTAKKKWMGSYFETIATPALVKEIEEYILDYPLCSHLFGPDFLPLFLSPNNYDTPVDYYRFLLTCFHLTLFEQMFIKTGSIRGKQKNVCTTS